MTSTTAPLVPPHEIAEYLRCPLGPFYALQEQIERAEELWGQVGAHQAPAMLTAAIKTEAAWDAIEAALSAVRVQAEDLLDRLGSLGRSVNELAGTGTSPAGWTRSKSLPASLGRLLSAARELLGLVDWVEGCNEGPTLPGLRDLVQTCFAIEALAVLAHLRLGFTAPAVEAVPAT